MAKQNINKAHYLKDQLEAQGFKVFNQSPFFNEFVIQLDQPVKVSGITPSRLCWWL